MTFIFTLDRHIFRLEIMLQIDAHFLFRQIAQMSHGRLDHVIRAQILANGLCLWQETPRLLILT